MSIARDVTFCIKTIHRPESCAALVRSIPRCPTTQLTQQLKSWIVTRKAEANRDKTVANGSPAPTSNAKRCNEVSLNIATRSSNRTPTSQSSASSLPNW